MIEIVCAVYDIKAKTFLAPWPTINDDTARRAMHDTVNDKNHQFNKHATDYILFKVGTWDDQTGLLQATAHENLGLAQKYKESSNGNGTAEPA